MFFGAGIYFTSINGIMDLTGGRVPGAGSRAINSGNGNTASSPPVPEAGWVTSLRTFGAGATARAVAASIMSPVAVVKTRAEWGAAVGSPYRTTVGGIRHILRTQGVSALYAGLIPTIIRDSPFSGFYYMTYSFLKTW